MSDWQYQKSEPPNEYRFHCGTVYILCWEVGHYVGFTTDILRRLQQHREGKGALPTKTAVKAGYKLTLVEIYQHTTVVLEQKLQEHFTCLRCGYTGPMKIKSNKKPKWTVTLTKVV